ncbi:MAG TPA: patatin-like phospholipase family protein, partial [Gemmatimonadales bacterium]|nr:patatin-like phospholipase family protein [Gemmatimonadales bacterium]
MRVVAVFGGGGAKSVAHVGARRALAEAGITPMHYVGTSFGAVMAAALASGVTHEALATALLQPSREKIAVLDLVSVAKGVFADHLLKPGPLRALIEQLVPARAFEDLATPLTVTATDLDSGESVLFGAGSGERKAGLHEALYASCALPLYYPPAVIERRRYADGGLRAVLPLEAARTIRSDLVVAVHVGAGFDEPEPTSPTPRFPPALVRAHGAAERIMMAAQVERAIAAWPDLGPRLIVVRAVAER